MKDNGCYLCKSDTKYLFEKNNRKYAKCLSCGLVYIASLKDPEKTELENHYSQKESTHQEKLNKKEYKKLIKRMEYRLGIIENYCHSKGKLLDIGCGQGSFLDVAKNNGWECSGVEISKNDCKYVREKLNIKVHNTELSGVNFPDDYFDAITLWHVFEHFIDPLTELKEIHRILSPGGIVCLEIPNIDSLAFRILGKKWKYINDEHIFYFNKKTIGRFIKTSGFKLMYITGISGFPWWGKYRGLKELIHGFITATGVGDHLVLVLKKI